MRLKSPEPKVGPESIAAFLARMSSVAFTGRFPGATIGYMPSKRADITPVAITVAELERLLALARAAADFSTAIATFSERKG